ncbi:TIGR03751 family conjugal transfer lipoprotein [Pseudomonas protegens]|uniref:TIGR03751 family conjugal transfer lipoprotein n=1 Tax=Pseudomonas protegens TaxID=380021 RepID=UPI00380B11AC
MSLQTSIKYLRPASVLLVVLLAGCSTSKEEMLPHGETTMSDVWDQGTTGSSSKGGNRILLDARQSLRRPLSTADVTGDQASYSRTTQNEIYSQFKRLPNPDLVMYVYPHLAGSDPAPVPGYTTVFPFYQRVQYAMPGERTEEY